MLSPAVRFGGVAFCAAMLMLFGGQASAATPGASDQAPATKHETKMPPSAAQTIPGSPVSAVIHDSASAAVYYNTAPQFFSDNSEGIYLWANREVWGPSDVPFGPTVSPYTPVSNTLIGTGTAQDPWRVITVANVGTTGLQLIRSVQYVNGNAYTRQDFEVRNTSGTTYSVSLFHAADLKTGGEDAGFGYYDSASGGIGGYNQARTFYQLFVPVTSGSHYKEGLWNDIWAAIGNTSGAGTGFDNSYHPSIYEDNGAGLQWSFTLAPGGRRAVADFHSFSTTVGCTVQFADVFASDYYFDPVNYLACNSIISGYSDNTFRPGNITTRAQLSKIMVNAEGWAINTTGAPHFRDVPSSHPFYAYVETAYNHGIVSGYGCGGPGEPCPGLYFRPNSNVTRAQLSKIVVNAEGWAINITNGPHFIDVPAGDAFYNYIETAYNRGVISGYACGATCLQFRPGNPATRGQISKIVYNAITQP